MPPGPFQLRGRNESIAAVISFAGKTRRYPDVKNCRTACAIPAPPDSSGLGGNARAAAFSCHAFASVTTGEFTVPELTFFLSAGRFLGGFVAAVFCPIRERNADREKAASRRPRVMIY